MLLPIKLALGSVCLLAGLNVRADVMISSPANGATVTSPLQLIATISGAQPRSILVYDDNSPIWQQQGISSIGTSLNLSGGSHTIMVKAVYDRGWNSSATSNITVSATPAPV